MSMDGCEFPECYCGDKPCSVMREKLLEALEKVSPAQTAPDAPESRSCDGTDDGTEEKR